MTGLYDKLFSCPYCPINQGVIHVDMEAAALRTRPPMPGAESSPVPPILQFDGHRRSGPPCPHMVVLDVNLELQPQMRRAWWEQPAFWNVRWGSVLDTEDPGRVAELLRQLLREGSGCIPSSIACSGASVRRRRFIGGGRWLLTVSGIIMVMRNPAELPSLLQAA